MRIDRLELDIVRRCPRVGHEVNRGDRFRQLLADLELFDVEVLGDCC